MSSFDIRRSFERAAARFGEAPAHESRRRRSDAGRFRLAPAVEARLRELLGGQDKPSIQAVLRELEETCAARQERAPSRATVYQYMARARTPERRAGDLAPAARQALHNATDDSLVPEAQIAFYCMNRGGLSAMSFAAGLPWLALYQAARMRGWRPKSRGVMDAVLRVRKIR